MQLSKFLYLILFLWILPKLTYAENKQFHTRNYTLLCANFEHDNGVGCSIKGNFVKHKYQPVELCKLDWGSNFSLDAKNNKAELDCASDPHGSGGADSILLNVGQTIKGKGWSCTALKNGGIKCMNISKKNGFILQKHRQILINK